MAKPGLYLRIERGAQALDLLVPRDEQLVFNVRLDLGMMGKVRVGTVTLSSTVEAQQRSVLLLTDSGPPAGERARLEARAVGGTAVYSLESTLTSLILPQAWPRIVAREVQTGSENRSRELMIGERDGAHGSRYRANGHCRGCQRPEHFIEPTWTWQKRRHCKKCKRAEHRTWRAWSQREVPHDTVDMVTAIYLARSMIVEGRRAQRFPMLDKRELWILDVRRGRRQPVKVPAGEFEAAEVLLATTPELGSDAAPEDFKGLFGIRGQVSIWFDAEEGVPVQITGSVPLGPVELDVEIVLASFRGTPVAFAAR